MEKKIINVDENGKRIFSDSVIAGNTLYISGQVGYVKGKENGFEVQFERIMEKIITLVGKAGGTLRNVVKVNVYIARRDDFMKMNELFVKHFPEHPPARATIVTELVNDEMLVELEAVAVL